MRPNFKRILVLTTFFGILIGLSSFSMQPPKAYCQSGSQTLTEAQLSQMKELLAQKGYDVNLQRGSQKGNVVVVWGIDKATSLPVTFMIADENGTIKVMRVGGHL